MKKTIGFYKIELTACSLAMRLLDDFSGIKTNRKANDGSNPGFPKSEYPFMLTLVSGATVKDCIRIHGDHFAKMKSNKNYKKNYDLSTYSYRRY